jgi:hypothetical protein
MPILHVAGTFQVPSATAAMRSGRAGMPILHVAGTFQVPSAAAAMRLGALTTGGEFVKIQFDAEFHLAASLR